MKFKTVTVSEYCPTITFDFQISQVEKRYGIDVLIISFHGEYRSGSAGSPDAGLMRGAIRTGLGVFGPYSVLLDFSDLI